MITKDNFRFLLEKLEFKNENDVYIKKFNEFECELKVDFQKEELIFPTNKGFIVNDKTTSNFSSAENFVVFECVDKLLSQGYNPKHIELEPKWQVGHGASGGKADILIKDNDEKSLLIIECKTAGREFEKAWDITQTKPTQIFSYAQQDRDTKFIALYTSDFIDETVKSKYYLINLSDDNKVLFRDKSLLSYVKAKKAEDIYNVWSETYKKEFRTNGIFGKNKPYYIGVEKTNINDLNIVSSNDIKGKYHEFATIMRQHNIGSPERAFNVLVNLFLCKIIDESSSLKNSENSLEFYWKGISYDDAFLLQDRLQELYKTGMHKFLGEDITYISDSIIDKMFEIIDLNSLKKDVKEKFREQKFFTNNDFSFLDVHSEELFYKNFEVLLKVVKMFQDIRLSGVEDNQFLGDMFEGFLDQGVKQSEGQFFTPMPIVKFIIKSLPLDNLENIDEKPKVIDYACGAGHFLNEVAKVLKNSDIVGVEKEYRLSKVAKVSALMYGQDNVNIVYNDALVKHKDIQDNDFSVLVANPPYSVKGFLETLNKDDINSYELSQTVDKKSYTANNSIECFFIERAKQLLKYDGVVGIILPSSILNKGEGKNSYVKTREIILSYFDIVAICEFGSGTFGKTGTNTVTLFLKRKNDIKNIVGKYEDLYSNLFYKNIQTQKKFKDKYLVEKYCNYIDVNIDIYITIFENTLDENIFQFEIFREYKIIFEKLTTTKERKKKKLSKKSTEKEKEEIENKILLKYIKDMESNKFYYFCLAQENKRDILIIKSPTNGKDNKNFLGYEWSGRKGNEGIQYSGETLNNINTPLYNPQDIDDNTKINKLIKDNFENKNIDIPDELKQYVSSSRLIDMMDFKRVEFNKSINLNPAKKVEIKSKWELVKLGELVKLLGGFAFKSTDYIEKSNTLNFRQANIRLGGILDLEHKKTYLPDKFYTQYKEYILKDNDVVIAMTDMNKELNLLAIPTIIETKGYNLLLNQRVGKFYDYNLEKLKPKFLNEVLKSQLMRKALQSLGYGNVQSNLSKNDLLNIKIPLPPLNIQEKIVKECEIIDNKSEELKAKNDEYKKEIKSIINKNENITMMKLEELCLLKAGKFVSASQIKTEYLENLYPCFGGNGLRGYVETFTHNGTFPLIGRQGALCGNINLAKGKFHATEHAVVVTPKKDLEIMWLYYKLIELDINQYKTGVAQPGLSVKNINNIDIAVPSLKVQKQIVSKIETLESKIKENSIIIDSSKDIKESILKKYL